MTDLVDYIGLPRRKNLLDGLEEEGVTPATAKLAYAELMKAGCLLKGP